MHPRLPLALLGVLSLGLSGCVGEPASSEAAAIDPLSATAVATSELAVAWDGGFGLRAVACTPLGCPGQTLVGETERLHEIEGVTGGVAMASLTLTWTPSSPATEELGFGLFTCGGDCASDDDVGEVVAVLGGSPLVLEVEDFTVGPDETVFVFVNSPGLVPMLYVTASAPQDFHVEGLVTVAPAEAAAGAATTA